MSSGGGGTAKGSGSKSGAAAKRKEINFASILAASRKK